MKEVEEIKKFWNNRPCNIRHSKKEIGTLEYFEEVTKRRYFVEPHIIQFADFDSWKGKKVLEIGCGIGTDSIMFAKAGADLTCVELSDKSIEICKKRFDAYGQKAKFYIGNAEELSSFVPVEEYDLIYSFGVIHHANNPEKIISEIGKYMSKDSLCRIMLYSKNSWKSWEFFIRYGWKFGFSFIKTIEYFAEAQLNCPVANVYTKKSLNVFLSEYDIKKIEKIHIFKYSIKYYIEHVYKTRFIFRMFPERIMGWLSRKLGWHYLIEFRTKDINNGGL